MPAGSANEGRAAIYDWTETITPIKTNKTCCIATLAFDDEAYLISAAVLAHSLREANTTVDLVLFLSDTLHYSAEEKTKKCIALCKNVFDVIIIVTALEYRVSLDVWPRFQKLYSRWLPKCFTKLYMLKLKPYEKALFMDSDTIVFHNIDHIFDLKTPFGTLTSFRKEGLETGTRLARRTILLSLLNSYGISGAFFCITPDDTLFEIAKLHIKDKIRQNKSYYETPNDIDITNNLPPKRLLNAGPDEQIFTWLYSHDFTYNSRTRQYNYVGKDVESKVGGSEQGKEEKYDEQEEQKYRSEVEETKEADGEKEAKDTVRQAPRTKWTNVSRQYNCVPWLKHKFEKGYFPLRYPNRTYDGENPERKVYVVHYVTEKPWVTLAKTVEDPKLQLWPDVKWWYDVYDRLRKQYAPAFDEILQPLPPTVSFMSQEEADRIYEEDHQRLIERTREARLRKQEEREKERECRERDGRPGYNRRTERIMEEKRANRSDGRRQDRSSDFRQRSYKS